VGALTELSRQVLSGERSSGGEPSTGTAFDAAPWMGPRFVGEEVASGVFFVSSFANVTAIDTGEGLVLVDTGSFLLAEPTRALLRRMITRPVHTAVYTHGHVDHCFGVERYEAEAGASRVRVVAHEAVRRRFERYRLTQGYNARINGRQFRVDAQFPSEFREPDEVYAQRLELDVGGVRLELEHALGETDDHTFVWLPDRRVLCTGDLFIWASPNCGNPQKAQRYPREWAAALRRMASLEPEVLLPGHGLPIVGASEVRRALEETAELLESLVEQTLRLLNEGARLDRILAEVRAPEALLRRPYLTPVYDEPEFVVRNLYRLYAGWWDGNPASLKPAREAERARELVALAGGVAPVVARAKELCEAGELALAAELVELATNAEPSSELAHGARAEVYEARAAEERSLMAKGIFGEAAEASRDKLGEAR
jgi:alkyl sulfatase BDS1-like metallo-beta-lactamase superfamily hydrolase